MPQSEKVFHEFWREIKSDILCEHFKVLIRLPLAIIGAIVVVRLLRCAGIGVDEELRQYECSIVLNPILLFESLMSFFPIMMKGIVAAMPFLFCAVLYLEWDRYKKDEASHLGGYWGWTVPNRPWSRSNFERLVTGQAWEGHPNLSFKALDAHSAQVTGTWSDAEILRIIQGVSRRYTSLLRKPRRQSPDGIEWHFLINGGDELTITFERTTPNTSNWRLTVQLYEWAGRRQPPRLAQTHTTEFVLQANGEAKPSI